MKNIKTIIVIFLVILLQESVFMLFAFRSFENIILKIIFLLQVAVLINTICLFKEKVNKAIINIFLIITTIFCISQYTYYIIFESSIGLYDILKSGQMIHFTLPVITVIFDNIVPILLLIIPLIIYLIFSKKLNIEKNTKKEESLLLIIFCILYVISTCIINLNKENDIYSLKNLYYNINDGTENLKNFGFIQAARLDVQRIIFPFKEKVLYEYKDSDGNVKIIDRSKYNMIDIDFDKLIANETNKEIKEIHEYIKSQEPTNKNEYTGKFKDKNLIFIVGESFSLQAINKDITPTLYKLYNDSIQFENFYTPLFPVSTADGQYLADTGILPAEAMWSIEEVDGKLFPYTYGNVFKKMGYETFAYHNNYYDYYKRHIYFDTLGYDTYLGLGNGLEERMDFSKRPSSDYDMIKATVSDYIDKEKFVAYYITMSGHMNYDETNAIVVKNWEQVKDLSYSKKAKSYLATQIEFDRAVKELIDTLEEKDKMKDTVIVILGDHYPYGLSKDEIIELTSYEMKDYDIDKFRMPFIIHTGEKQSDIKVIKNASSLDVLPTMLNLFGIEYDSRLLMGKDIFSNSESLVIFSNRSFITENEIYSSNTELLCRNGKIVNDNEYLKNMKQKIFYKYRYSRLILENNYYKSIFNK